MGSQWTHRRIPLSWGRMSAYVAGEGRPLLLLHGLGGSGRYWAGAARLLAARHRLIAPDLAGFGFSDKPDVEYSSDFHVRSLVDLLGALGVGETAVAGHSMGGVLAAVLARRRPRTVASLALVATPFPRRQERPYGVPDSGVRRFAYRGAQRVLPLLSPLVRSATFPREVVADYLRHTVASYQRTSRALIWDPALAAELEGLDSVLDGRPQLLLFSAEDRTIRPDSLTSWRGVLPRAHVETVSGGHQLLLRDHFASLAHWYGARVPAGA